MFVCFVCFDLYPDSANNIAQLKYFVRVSEYIQMPPGFGEHQVEWESHIKKQQQLMMNHQLYIFKLMVVYKSGSIINIHDCFSLQICAR